MAKILIVYSTTDGHTVKICKRVKERVEEQGNLVTLMSINDVLDDNLPAFDKIVIGASIRYGKHNPLVAKFVDRNVQMLNSKANAFFTVNIVARKPEKNRPDTNPYMQKFLKQISWRPKNLEVFAGKLDYPRYGFVDRQMIRFIMLITKGPTDPKSVIEFTDWQKVDAFAQTICRI